MRACLAEFVKRPQRSVIPVLLPNVFAIPKLPLFLAAFTWVDLRNGLTDQGLEKLVWGITGKKPNQNPKDGELHPPKKITNPFLGLRAFQSKDVHLFYGRDKEIKDILNYIGSPAGRLIYRWLQIEGNSGAGKSSLVNAGILPKVQRGELSGRAGFSQWKILGSIPPSEKPLLGLAELLEKSPALSGTHKRGIGTLYEDLLKKNDTELACYLRQFKEIDTAFLLVVDQFEELFTFSAENERRGFDKQLAYALRDAACPLFLVTTVRIDFLSNIEQLPSLAELQNTHCKRYILKTISQEGLREVIEKPAALAGLDVSEITTALLEDAKNEVGALPLVENALYCLYEKREDNRLSGKFYIEQHGMIGLLQNEADALLDGSGNKNQILELLLAMTRIDPEGRHTRRRISQEEAQRVAGYGNPQRGQEIIDYLSGTSRPNGSNHENNAGLRLITSISADSEKTTIDKLRNHPRNIDPCIQA